MNKTKEEIGEVLFESTCDYTEAYFGAFPESKGMDRQMWAAFHLGFISGMKFVGYDEDLLSQALKICQTKLAGVDELAKKK